MKIWGLCLLLVAVSGIMFAEGVQVVEDNESGTLTVDNGQWKYIFRTKDNLLTDVVQSGIGKTLLSQGARWIYHTHSGAEGDRRKAFRQGQVKDPAGHEIIRADDGRVEICLNTKLNAIQIEEVYIFEPNGTIEQRYEIETVETIPDMALFCWEARLGVSGEMADPFDRFCWGNGPGVLRNETELKTIGEIRGPTIRVSDTREWISCYWLKPSDLQERFIALQNSESGQYWMLAFEPDGQQPWFFLGDVAKGRFSEWFGFRVFGETVFSKTMPTYRIEKGTKWSGTVGHIIGTGKNIEELSVAYKKWQSEKK